MSNKSNFFAKFKAILLLVIIVGILTFISGKNKTITDFSQTNQEVMAEALQNQEASVFSSIKNFFSKLFKKKDTKSIGSSQSANALLSSLSSGQNIFFSDGTNSVINTFDLASHTSTSVSSDGIALIEDTPGEGSSFIVKFKSKPVAVRSKELLKTQGVTLKVGTDRNLIKQKLANVSGDLTLHRNKIATEQNKLLNKFSSKYQKVTPENLPSYSLMYKDGDRYIRVNKHSMSINAVTIENISEGELTTLLKGVPDISSIEPVKTVTPSLIETPNIIHSIDLAEYVGPNGAYLTGQGIKIGIIDTGVDYTHQDFGSCSFLTSAGCKVVGGFDFINNDFDPMDDHGHGTHVAATAAGNGFYTNSNGIQVPLLGIAPDAEIYAYKVLGANGSGTTAGILLAIDACVDPNSDGDISDHLDVCSMSLGHAGGNPLEMDSLAVDAATEAGVIFTIAAGNAGPGAQTIGGPGTSRKAITVGASCKPGDIGSGHCTNGAIANFSSRGPVIFTNEQGVEETLVKPDIVSPGVNICAAQWGSWADEKSCLGDGEHIAINGTSMATPTVAGLVALLAQAHPEKTPAEIKEVLKLTATNLGFSQNSQGAGLVSGIASISALGIPSSFLGVAGLPLSIFDSSTAQTASYTKTPTIKNITDEVQNITITSNGSNPGVSVSFDDSFTLTPDEEIDFPIDLVVDHENAHAGYYVAESLVMSNGEEDLPLVVSRFTPNKLELNSTKMDFGLFHVSQENFEETVSLGMTNRMTEQSITYDIIIDQFDSNNISISSESSEVTIGPNSTENIDFTVSAFSNTNNVLPNNMYTTYVHFISETEEHTVQIYFYRGYSFVVDFSTEAPDSVILYSPSGNVIPFSPTPGSNHMTFYSKISGPFDVDALYLDETSNNNYEIAHNFKFDISLTNAVQIPHYNLDRTLAIHSISNEFFGNSCFYDFSKGVTSRFKFMGVGYLTISHNTLPSDYRFSLNCNDFDAENDKLITSQIFLTEGLNQDFVLNSSTADTATRYVYAFDNKNENSELVLGSLQCGSRSYHYEGAIESVPSLCSLRVSVGSDYIPFPDTGVVAIESNSLYTDTPESSDYPDYPSFRIVSYDLNSEYVVAYSPELFLTSEKVYAWQSPTSGMLSSSTSSHDMYQKYKIDYPNDTYISIGAGPVLDTSSMRSFKDSFNFFSDYSSSFLSSFMLADGSRENFWMYLAESPINVSHSFTKDGSLFASKNQVQEANGFTSNAQLFPKTDGSFSQSGTTALGSYFVESSRLSPFAGFPGSDFKKTISTNISNNVTIDGSAPAIQNIQIIANGLLQNVYDPLVQNTIKIKASAVFGISSHNLESDSFGAYDISFLPDAISEINLSHGSNPNSLTDVPLSYDGEYYTAVFSGGGEGLKEYFEVSISDQADNESMYNFSMPVSASYSESDIFDPGLVECVPQLPTINIVPNPVSGAIGEIVPMQAVIKNNNSVGCGQWSFKVSAKNVPMLGPLRFGVSPTIVSGFTISTMFNDVSSGEEATWNFYMKSSSGVPGNTYQAMLKITNSSIDMGSGDYVYEFPFNLVEEGDEPMCEYGNPTLNISGLPNALIENANASSFTVTVTNNNNTFCEPETYNLNVSDSNAYVGVSSNSSLNSSSLFSGQVLINSGATSQVPLFIKAFPGSSVSNVIVNATLVGTTPDVSVSGISNTTIAGVCEGDFSNDNKVNISDLLLLSSGVNSSNLSYDLNGDGVVNVGDTSYLSTIMGNTCSTN